MGKNSIRRRQLRVKFKRRTAALMGAALMTGAVLSGVPATNALAADTTTHVYPVTAKHVSSDDSRPPGRGWHQHRHSWPSSDENQAWYQDGKIYYRSGSGNVDKSHAYLRDGKLYYRGESGYNYSYYVNSPVEYVKDNAARYGFNSYRDSFSLLTASSQRAVVEVRRNDTGKLYNVILERTSNRDWTIVDVRAI